MTIPGCRMPQTADAEDAELPHLSNNLFFRVSMLNFLMGRALAPLYTAEGLQSHEWKVLGVLWSYAPLPASGILQHVTFDKAALSRALAHLEELELIVRRSQPDNRRSVDIRLSRRGQQVYRRILTGVTGVQRELLAGLSSADARNLFRTFDAFEEKLLRRLELNPRTP